MENEPGEECEAGSLLILNGVDPSVREFLESEFCFDFFTFANEGEGDFIAREFTLYNLVHIYELACDADVASAVDAVSVDA